MRMPGIAASTAIWSRVTLYLIGRLARDALTRDLVEAVKPVRDRLVTAAATTARAEEDLTLAQANLDGSDDDADRMVGGFEAELLASVGRNREASIYRHFFPKGLRAVTTAEIPDEVRILKTWDGDMAGEHETNPVCARHRPLIAGARAEVERHIPLHQAALDACAATWSRELAARAALRRQYRVIYGDLIRTFPDDRRRVESYFRDPGSPRRPDTDDAERDEPAPERATTPDGSPAAGPGATGTGAR